MGISDKIATVVEKTSDSTGVPSGGVLAGMVTATVIAAHTVIDMVTYDDAPKEASTHSHTHESSITQKDAIELIQNIDEMITHYNNGGYLRYRFNSNYMVHMDSTNLVQIDGKYYIFEIGDGHTHEITDFEVVNTQEVE